MLYKLFIAYGALVVVLGAFGAHALDAVLVGDAKAWYETGIQYAMFHTLAGLLFLQAQKESVKTQRNALLLLIGMTIFMVSLIGLALTPWRFLGAITPIGGVLMVLFWINWARIN